MFVGEAPGAEEDRQGLPFVGRAGQLLSELLGEIGLSRDDVFIANVLKSPPPGNRDPLPAEIEACKPYLWRQIELIQPQVIATLGNFATKLLSGSPPGSRGFAARRRSTSSAGARCSCSRCSIRRRRCGPRDEGHAPRRLREAPGLLATEPPAPGPEPVGDAGRSHARSPTSGPTSSSCSVERSPPRDPPRPRRSAARLPPGPGPATWSSSPASWAREDDSVRGACRALGVAEPVTSPTFTSAGAIAPASSRLPPGPLPPRRARGRGAGAARRLPDARRDRVRRVAGRGRSRRMGARAAGDVRVAARVELRHAGGDRREIEVAP